MTVKNKKYKANGITIGMIFLLILSMSFVLLLALIKIYLSNQIYYESKTVNTVQQEVSTLKAQKLMLQQKIEALKFKNKVTDTIFTINNDEE